MKVSSYSKKEPTKDEKKYQELKQSILNLRFIRWGSLVKRYMPCGKQGCRCQGNQSQWHGPYYQWTRKVKGKTVTVRLSTAEAKVFEEWIANGRQLDRIISQMGKISLRVTNRLLKLVPIS